MTPTAALRRTLTIGLAGAVLFAAAACEGGGPEAPSASRSVPTQKSPPRSPEGALAEIQKPIEPFQQDLLELAFDTATKMPVEPHVKDRSREQQAAVEACLALGQPVRALEYLRKVENWRQGACWADLAFYCARNGLSDLAEAFLERAGEHVEKAEDWRRQRIRAKMSRVYVALERSEEASAMQSDLGDAETGRLTDARAMLASPEDFEQQVAALEATVEPSNFDATRGALGSLVQLFGRFYEDAERRALVEENIDASLELLPIFLRIELLGGMVEFALDHGDQAKARELLDRVDALISGSLWPPADEVARRARLAAQQFRAGAEEQARAGLAAATALYEENEDARIVNIDRAGALRPIAETWFVMGEREKALSVYAQALEAGVENPNSRPRAEDLAATCRSMALRGVEPTPEIRARIGRIQADLGVPW